MEMVSGDNRSYNTWKASVESSPPTSQHQTFYRPDALLVAQPTMSEHWMENSTFQGLVHHKLTWGLPTLSLTTKCSWLPWRRVAMPLISPVMPVLHNQRPCRTLRSASANLLSVTRCNLSFGTRGFRTAAPTVWNSLPANVRSSATLSTSRRHLKSHLFQSNFPTT